jgi:hypothetical protein
MMLSELPSTATVVSPGVWSDTLSRHHYVVDPSDATLLLSRDWTAAEQSTFNQAQAALSTNGTTLATSLSASITTLTADLGLAVADPLLVKDSTSINGISKSAAATINADPGVYIVALAKFLRRAEKAIIAVSKIELGQLTDASTGQ